MTVSAISMQYLRRKIGRFDRKLFLRTAMAAILLGVISPTFAHGDQTHATKPPRESPEQHAWGKQGDPRRASRTFTVAMRDTMRFSPDTFSVRVGETVRFVFKNEGGTLHEWVLGTEKELAEHAELMKKFPSMEHSEPYMVHVKPNARGEVIWTFNRAGRFSFGCLIPGHWEAGMRGIVIVEPHQTVKLH